MKATMILCLLAMLVTSALSQVPPTPAKTTQKKSAGFDPKRDAARDIQEAIAKAKKEGKRILLDVGGEW